MFDCPHCGDTHHVNDFCAAGPMSPQPSTPMTPPMTPREKVVFKQPCEHCQRMTTVDLTALASGSGDHAELARLAEEAGAPMSTKTIGMHLDATEKFQKAANPATVLALLAENAALRAERDEWRNTVRFNERCWSEERGVMIDRATEAERKLAEADQVIRDIAETPYTGADWPRSRAATFLSSKEAERG